MFGVGYCTEDCGYGRGVGSSWRRVGAGVEFGGMEAGKVWWLGVWARW